MKKTVKKTVKKTGRKGVRVTKVVGFHKEPCYLCERKIPLNKRMNNHHISYIKDITIPLCFSCHQIVHGRHCWGNVVLQMCGKYGKDIGMYAVACRIIRIYESMGVEYMTLKHIEDIDRHNSGGVTSE